MKILILFCCLMPLTFLAQNWNPFPYQQKSHFSYNSYFMDSIRTSGEDSIFYFTKINDRATGNCSDNIWETYVLPFPLFQPDSLLERNDTIFYASEWSDSPFYFLPKATPGQNWTITSTYPGNTYNQMSIHCEIIGITSFWGITDSIKVFSAWSGGVNNANFVLSKNYGFLEMVPFDLFHYHPPGMDFYSELLSGIESQGTHYGYRQKALEDYFHLAAGDILHWREDHISDAITEPDWAVFHRDSITHVSANADSVVYTYDRTTLDQNNELHVWNGQIRTYRRQEFDPMIKALLNEPALVNNFLSGSFFEGAVFMWGKWDHTISFDALSGDSLTSIAFFTEGKYLDTLTCEVGQLVDWGHECTLNTLAGLVQHCQYLSSSHSCETLVGSKINGMERGSLHLGLDESLQNDKNVVNFYPNPVQEKIFFKNQTFENNFVQIFDMAGKLILSEKITGQAISVKEFEKGLYTIRIGAGENHFQGKFIKE